MLWRKLRTLLTPMPAFGALLFAALHLVPDRRLML
mgnify:CR=1 FL=1